MDETQEILKKELFQIIYEITVLGKTLESPAGIKRLSELTKRKTAIKKEMANKKLEARKGKEDHGKH